MGTLRISFWQQVVVLHAPYGTQNNGRTLFYFILISSIVSLFFILFPLSLFPKQLFFPSSHKISILVIPMHILQPSFIPSLSSEWFSYGHRWRCSRHSVSPIHSLLHEIIYGHTYPYLSFHSICLFVWLLWSKYTGFLNICLEYTVHINLRDIIILLWET